MAQSGTETSTNNSKKKKKSLSKKLSEAKQKGINVITDLQTQVNRYPEFKSLVDAAVGNSTESSIDILLVLAKAIGITEDEIIAWIYKLIGGIKTKGADSFLDKIEYGVKFVLFLNIKNLLSCSVNPILDDELMFSYMDKYNRKTAGKGVKIKIDDIDLFGVLKKSPNSKGGSIFYFDRTESQVDEWKSCDFNAFIWYVINKGSIVSTSVAQKNVWDNRCKYYQYISENAKDASFGKKGTYSADNRYAFFDIPNDEDTIAKEGTTIKISGKDEMEKKKFLYCSYASSDGTGNSNILTIWANPYRYYKTRKIKIPQIKAKSLKYNYKEIEYSKIPKDYRSNVVKKTTEASATSADYVYTETNDTKTYYKKISDNTLTSIVNVGVNSTNSITDYVNNKLGLNKTILEFNWDYIFSIKLFDTKTILANIINAVTNGVEGQASFNFSYEQAVLKQQVQQIVKGIINADDETVIDDTYFTFSNEEYDTMLENAAKERMAQYKNDVTGEITEIDSDAIIDALINLDSATTSAGTITAISNAFSGVTATSGATNEVGDDNYSFQWNFVTKIINEFTYQIALQLLSPKFAILYAFNSAMMGDMFGVASSGTTKNDKAFSMDDFKNYMTSIISASAKQIKNIIVTELQQIIYDKFKILLIEAKIKWAKERLEYYKMIINSLLEYWNLGKSLAKSLGLLEDNTATYIDNVDYADIIETKTSEEST